MKKILRNLALGLFALYSFNAQSQNFFETVTFTGALSEDASQDWTAGWTEWDPENKAYPAVTDSITINALNNSNAVSLSGTKVLSITSDLTLSSSSVYKLQGFIVVAPGVKLTIPAGTVIRGLGDAANGNYAALIVRPGAKLDVLGTSTAPVVFTSAKAPGNRATKNLQGKIIGDWGGIVLLGNATQNQTNPVLEGFADVNVGSLGGFGGSDDSDNSGSISYLRIEFAGLDFTTNKELNGLTLGAVGSGTSINFVQSSFGGDDAFEWFGGSVNCKHLIAYATTDDDFDTDFGYHGKVQFGIGVKDSSRFDITYSLSSGGSTSEGFESDNDASGSTLTPQTNAEFANFTMIGPVPVDVNYSQCSAVTKAAFRRGARIRRNSAITIRNSIFSGYRNVVMYDGDLSFGNAGIANGTYTSTSKFINNIVWKSDVGTSTNTVSGQGSTLFASNNGWGEVATGKSNVQLPALATWLKNSTSVGNKFDSTLTSTFSKKNLFINAVVGSGFSARPKAVDRFQVGTVAGIISNEGEFVGSVAYAYPNPTEDVSYLTFTSAVSTPASVSVFDLTGVQVNKFDTFVNAGSNNILVDGLESGSYIVKLSTPRGSVMTFKVLKF